jgi:hypothetical protein
VPLHGKWIREVEGGEKIVTQNHTHLLIMLGMSDGPEPEGCEKPEVTGREMLASALQMDLDWGAGFSRQT